MNNFDRFLLKLNSQQKIILSIAVPLILFFIILKIAGIVGQTNNFFSPPIEHPFAFQKTWWVWVLFILLTTYFEYKFFEKGRIDK